MSSQNKIAPNLCVAPELHQMTYQGLMGVGENRTLSEFSICGNVIRVQRGSETGYDLSLQIPIHLFYGIALYCEQSAEAGDEIISLYLIMDDHDIAIPVYCGRHHENLLPFWYDWQDAHGLTPMIVERNGKVRDLVSKFQPITRKPPHPRRMQRMFIDRRPSVVRRNHFVSSPIAPAAKSGELVPLQR